MRAFKKISENSQEKFLRSLDTPQKVQDYLDSISFNHEHGGETWRSPYEVLTHKEAHCMEGAFLACLALSFQKRPMLILSLRVTEDDRDHVLTLFKEKGYWGAISKTNHSVLGFRDPVYKTVRELAMSYFHEYFLPATGIKSLRGYSRPINLKKFRDFLLNQSDNLFMIAEYIYDRKHYPALPKNSEGNLRKASPIERAVSRISQENYTRLLKDL